MHAVIHCHSKRDAEQVQRYLSSTRYQRLLAATGQSLEMSTKELGDPDLDVDVIIAPGNSLGIMTGGFDEGLIDAYGPPLQKIVRDEIRNKHEGELNVGDAILVPVPQGEYPTKLLWVAYAPTMRAPQAIAKNSDIPYLATRAALIQVRKGHNIHCSVLVPLMGVGTGGLPIPYVCQQIQLAFASFRDSGNSLRPTNLANANKLTQIITNSFFSDDD